MTSSVSLVVAACSNRGIGINGRLPWKLSADMAHFKKITSRTQSPDKMNAVIMGRKTWDSIPAKFKPLSNRINIVISSSLELSGLPDVHVARSFTDAIHLLNCNQVGTKLERAFVIGGESVYKAAFDSGVCQRIYLTEIMKEFECDVFLPEFDQNLYLPTREEDINNDIQTDEGTQLQYRFMVYQRTV